MIVIKRVIRQLIAMLLYYSGFFSLYIFVKVITCRKQSPIILMYHRVLKNNDAQIKYCQPGMYVSADVFEKQMRCLARHYNLLSFEALTILIRDRLPLPPKSVVVTFDDGWRDNYTVAYPVLKKYAIPAIIFLTTDYINTNKQFWFQRVKYLLTDDKIDSRQLLDVILKVRKDYTYQVADDVSQYLLSHSPSAATDYFIEWLKNLDPAAINEILNRLAEVNNNAGEAKGDEPLMLSWAEVIEMNKGGIDFGSHGLSHRIMTGMNIEDVKTELVRSKEIIREQTGQEATIFAYPNGDCNDEIKKAVKDAGYYAAAATYGNRNNDGNWDLYGLTRVAVHEGISIGTFGSFSKAIFRCRLHGII